VKKASNQMQSRSTICNNIVNECNEIHNGPLQPHISTTNNHSHYRNHHQHHQQHQTSSLHTTTQPPPSSSSLILLSADETIALTQLFMPISLKHMSQSWVFIVEEDEEKVEDIDVDNDSDDEHRRRDCVGGNNSVKNGSDHDWNHEYENFSRIIEIDEHDNVIHMGGGDSVSISGNGDGSGGTTHQHHFSNEYKDVQQECEVQLRVLLGYLFRHLTSIMLLGTNNNQDHNSHDDEDENQSCFAVSLEESLYQLFRSTNANFLEQKDKEKHVNKERKLLIEDYIDLVSSFLVESIEYAIDVIDSASHYLRKFVSNNKTLDGHHHCFHHYGDVEVDQNLPSVGEKDEIVKVNALSIRRYIKDTIRHCSIVIGMIEIYYQDMKLHDFTASSDYSHMISLHNSYAIFVASFCTDRLLHGTYCWSNKSDIDTVGVLFDSADNILFRLSTSMAAICNDGKGGSISESTSIVGKALHNNKRRRPNERNFPFMDNANTIVFLRAFHSIQSNSLASENNKYVNEILNRSLTDVSNSLRWSGTRNFDNASMGNRNFSLEVTNFMQTCALSTLMMTGSESQHLKAHETPNEVKLFSSLLVPMMQPKSELDNTEDQIRKTAQLVDPLNPWTYLLSNKLSERSRSIGELNYSEHDTTNLPAAISTSSVSSVSDLKSNLASSQSKGSNGHHTNRSNIDCKKVITHFLQAVPESFDTLCG
jgi:hypothetical protein